MKYAKVLLPALLFLALTGCQNDTKDASAANSNNANQKDAASETKLNTSKDDESLIETLMNNAQNSAPNTPELKDSVVSLEGKDLADIPSSYDSSADSTVNFLTPTPIPMPEQKSSSDSVSSNTYGGTTGNGTPLSLTFADSFVTVAGYYDRNFANNILKEINAARAEIKVPSFEVNPSLRRIADNRAKEITFYYGPIRADWTPYSSMCPEYYLAETMACSNVPDAPVVVEALLSQYMSRTQLLNPDYRSIGISCFEYKNKYYVITSIGK